MDKKKAKKMVILGDSISTKNHGEGGYEGLLKNSLGLVSVENYAVSSSGLSYGTPNNGVSILEGNRQIGKDADIILIWHGSNDWYWGSPIGCLDDNNADTFLGAVQKTVRMIRTRNKDGLIIWPNPIYRLEKPFEGEEEKYAGQRKNKVGNTLFDYRQALETAGKYHGFYVVDMYVLSGIHETNCRNYLEDEAHPNIYGYQRIHRVLDYHIKMVMAMAGYELN